MKFLDIYSSTIKLWPELIHIDDGKYIKETNGFYSQSLSNAWNKAEASIQNEWQELMVWIIFQFIHKRASELYAQDEKKITINDINSSDIKEQFENALKDKVYKHLADQYFESK